MIARLLIAVAVLAGCRTLPPSSPAVPHAAFPTARAWLTGEPIRISTAWQAKCSRRSPALDRSEHHEGSHDEDSDLPMMFAFLVPVFLPLFMHWEYETVDCDPQDYTVSVTCTHACTSKPAPRGGGAFVTVTEPGATTVTIALDHAKTRQRHEASTELLVIDPAQIELQCLDPADGSYASCATRPLDPAHPQVRVMSDSLGALHAVLDRGRTAIAIDLDEPGGTDPIALDDALGVRPLPPGTYEIELIVRGERMKRRVRVAPGRPAGH